MVKDVSKKNEKKGEPAPSDTREPKPTQDDEPKDRVLVEGDAPQPAVENLIKKRKIDPLEDFPEYMASDEKAQRFMVICVAAGRYAKLQDLKDELAIRQFLADFEAWKKAGEPAPSMPKLPKSDIKFPTAIYRLRDRKEDKMYVYFSDGTEEGVKYIPKYEQIENPVSGEMEDSKIKIGQSEEFDMKFTAGKAEKLIDDYVTLAPPGTNPLQLYYWFGDNKQVVSEKNLFKSHEELSELHNNKKALN